MLASGDFSQIHRLGDLGPRQCDVDATAAWALAFGGPEPAAGQGLGHLNRQPVPVRGQAADVSPAAPQALLEVRLGGIQPGLVWPSPISRRANTRQAEYYD